MDGGEKGKGGGEGQFLFAFTQLWLSRLVGIVALRDKCVAAWVLVQG